MNPKDMKIGRYYHCSDCIHRKEHGKKHQIIENGEPTKAECYKKVKAVEITKDLTSIYWCGDWIYSTHNPDRGFEVDNNESDCRFNTKENEIIAEEIGEDEFKRLLLAVEV